MTEQELREKIVKLIKEACLQHSNICTPNGDCRHCKYDGYKDCTEYAVADALISAGIGDVSEWKHRAKVAERALINASKCVDCKNCLYKNTQYLSIDNCYDRFLLEAEKELQEERKND